MQLKTGISLVYGTNGEPLKDDNKEDISLFDKLLEGGLEIPDAVWKQWRDKPTNQKYPPIALLLAGPPGTGKTTLAMELVYRLSMNGITEPAINTNYKFPSVYISSESPGRLLIENKAREFGWKEEYFRLVLPNDELESPQQTSSGAKKGWVAVYGKDAQPLQDANSPSSFFETFKRLNEYGTLCESIGDRPGVVVVDSLNVLPPNERAESYREFVKAIRGPFLLVLILDARPGDEDESFWGYAADVVLRLDQKERSDPRIGSYLLREFSVSKSRWQKHALGPHQIKIFGNPKDKDAAHLPPTEASKDKDAAHLPPREPSKTSPEQRLLPYRVDGGIGVFQSIHRHLSEGRRSRKPDSAGGNIQFDPSPLPELNEIMGGGFPVGRCSAFIGARGGMKSHLAYLWLLLGASGIRPNEKRVDGEKALLVSLRDDESEALSRLSDLHEKEKKAFPGVQSPRDLIGQELLRIVHFRPGYIAPDEFMFRLWFHLTDFKPTRVVVNTVEQLETLFPLCSIEPVFIPAMVDLLTQSRGITTIAIGVGEPEIAGGHYGLLPESSLILSFKRDNAKYVKAGEVLVEVVRVPSAGKSGAQGIMRLDDQNHLGFRSRGARRSLRRFLNLSALFRSRNR